MNLQPGLTELCFQLRSIKNYLYYASAVCFLPQQRGLTLGNDRHRVKDTPEPGDACALSYGLMIIGDVHERRAGQQHITATACERQPASISGNERHRRISLMRERCHAEGVVDADVANLS